MNRSRLFCSFPMTCEYGSWRASIRFCARIGTMNRCASQRRGPDRGSATRSLLGSWKSLIYYDQVSEKKIQVNEKTMKLRGAKVAPNFFGFLRIRPLAGRTFLPDDGGEA